MVVGQRMDDDGSVLFGFYYFVEIVYCVKVGCYGEWVVVLFGVVGVEQKLFYEVGGCYVFVIGNGYQGLVEMLCYVFYEMGFVIFGWFFEYDGNVYLVSGFEQCDFFIGGVIKWFFDDCEILQGVGYDGSLIEVGFGLYVEIFI